MKVNDPNAYIRVREMPSGESFQFYCKSCTAVEQYSLPIDGDVFFTRADAFEAEHERLHSPAEGTK